MKILIIEDEPYAAEALISQIKKLRPGCMILATLGTIEEAVRWFQHNTEPDLILSDIHLADGNSFEIFRKVQPHCPVIFTTAYDEYAIEAFTVNSIDYLLKPVKKEYLEKALSKLEARYMSTRTEINKKIQALLNQLTPRVQRFAVQSGTQMFSIPIENVAYFISEDGVTLLVAIDKRRYVIDYTLEQLEGKLPNERFFRLNRQVISSIESILEVHPYFKGRLLIKLNPPTPKEQVVSSQKSSAFKSWFGF